LGRLSRLERKADFLSIIAIPAGAFVAAWLFYQIAVLFEQNTQTAYEGAVTFFLGVGLWLFFKISKIS
jgi:hypothetical protein